MTYGTYLLTSLHKAQRVVTCEMASGMIPTLKEKILFLAQPPFDTTPYDILNPT